MAACVAVLATPAVAAAHTELKATKPVDGAQLPAAPAVVVVRYSTPLAEVVETSARVDGDDAIGGAARLSPTDASRLRIPLSAKRDAGLFTVRWVVRSVDAHLLEGELSFTVVRPFALSAVRRVGRAVVAVAAALTTSSSS